MFKENVVKGQSVMRDDGRAGYSQIVNFALLLIKFQLNQSFGKESII